MKKVLLFSIVAAFLVACGGGKKESISTTSITLPFESEFGDFAEYVTFPSELKIKLVEQSESSNDEKLEAIATISIDVKEMVGSDGDYCFDLVVADEDYTTIVSNDGICDFENHIEDDIEDFYHIISKGVQRTDVTFKLTPNEWNNVVTNGAHIIIKPRYGMKFVRYSDLSKNKSSENADDNVSSSETEDNDVSSSDDSSGGSFDDLLDSFERYVDKYITFMKKAKDGDASAMSEYPGLLKEAQDYSKKIQNVKGQLTADQIEKYQRINNKMLKAAQELQ